MRPHDLGLPEKFGSWRPYQQEAMWAAALSEKRFVALNCPTGFGKSPMYMALSQLVGGRTVILTRTKGLQDQLMRDFSSMGLVDMRGQANYPCIYDASRPDVTVEDGPCHSGVRCSLKEAGCPYFDDLRKFKRSQLGVTNYSYWLYANAYGDGLGPVDTLILDEAHDSFDALGDFLSTFFGFRELREAGLRHPPKDPAGWSEWGAEGALAVSAALSRLTGVVALYSASSRTLREIKHLKELVRRLKAISGLSGRWILQSGDRGYRWDPVWPQEYARVLFRDIPKVVFVSATVRPRTLELLGLHPEDYDFFEYPSTFQVSRRRIYVVPTVRLNASSSDNELRAWVARIDHLVGQRLDRNGIIHTVSYKRRDYLLSHSRHRDLFLTHDTATTREVVERFKSLRADPPHILVSPSVTTGWDFPYAECEYQIIGKVPFPDLRDQVLQARMADDKGYLGFVTMTELQQMVGRGMRAADDRCETLIVDDAIRFFMRANAKFASRWFRQAMAWVKIAPPPPPRLRADH